MASDLLRLRGGAGGPFGRHRSYERRQPQIIGIFDAAVCFDGIEASRKTPNHSLLLLLTTDGGAAPVRRGWVPPDPRTAPGRRRRPR